MKNFISLYKPTLSNEEKKNVLKCLSENWISSKGKFIKMLKIILKKNLIINLQL